MTSRQDFRDATSPRRRETLRNFGSPREATRDSANATEVVRSMDRKPIPACRKSAVVKTVRIADTRRISMRPNISSPHIVCALVIYGRSLWGFKGITDQTVIHVKYNVCFIEKRDAAECELFRRREKIIKKM